MIDVKEDVVDQGPVRILIREIHSAGNGAGRVARVVVAGRVAMDVQEDVSFDPGIGAVEIQAIVARAVEDIVDDLEDWPSARALALATGEVDRVVETPGMAKIVVAENPVTACGDAVDSVQALRTAGRRVGRKITVLNDEGAAIEGDVFHDRRWRPGAVIDEDRKSV